MSKEEFFRDLSFTIATYFVEIYPDKSPKWRLQRATYLVAKLFDEFKTYEHESYNSIICRVIDLYTSRLEDESKQTEVKEVK